MGSSSARRRSWNRTRGRTAFLHAKKFEEVLDYQELQSERIDEDLAAVPGDPSVSSARAIDCGGAASPDYERVAILYERWVIC